MPQVLHECRVLAGMRDPHIVRYYNCWHTEKTLPSAPSRVYTSSSGQKSVNSRMSQCRATFF